MRHCSLKMTPLAGSVSALASSPDQSGQRSGMPKRSAANARANIRKAVAITPKGLRMTVPPNGIRQAGTNLHRAMRKERKLRHVGFSMRQSPSGDEYRVDARV